MKFHKPQSFYIIVKDLHRWKTVTGLNKKENEDFTEQKMYS